MLGWLWLARGWLSVSLALEEVAAAAVALAELLVDESVLHCSWTPLRIAQLTEPMILAGDGRVWVSARRAP